MNLDGREDLLAAQNYARFPANDLPVHYPGKILQNYGDGFKPVEEVAGAENRLCGIAPIVSDFNGDGWPDLVWANLDGPSIAYLNTGDAAHESLTVRLPNAAASLNARVVVTDSNDQVQAKQLITSQGLGSDQGRDLIFGLVDATSVKTVAVHFQNGDDFPIGLTTSRSGAASLELILMLRRKHDELDTYYGLDGAYVRHC